MTKKSSLILLLLSFLSLIFGGLIFSQLSNIPIQDNNQVDDTSDELPTLFSFAVIGDYGKNNEVEKQVAEMVKAWNPEFIITTGDNNYDRGEAGTIDDNIGKFYADFIGGYQGMYGTGNTMNKFFPSLGNHDWETEEAQPYIDYFNLPGNERYYDFVQGPIHFFALDSDPREPDGVDVNSIQSQWLQQNLASSNSLWQIVYFHHPPYSSGREHGPTEYMQWPFAQWGADMVISGHEHLYERLTVDSIPYIINGLGGANRYGFNEPLSQSEVRYTDNWGAQLGIVSKCKLTLSFYPLGTPDPIDTVDLFNPECEE